MARVDHYFYSTLHIHMHYSLLFCYLQIHSMSLRRSVKGRSREFDDLLSDHRAAKDRQAKRRTADKNKSAAEKLEEKADKNANMSSLRLSAQVESEPIDTPPPAVSNDDDENSNIGHSKEDCAMSPAEPDIPEPEIPLPDVPPSFGSAWRARNTLYRSARLFSIFAPSHFVPRTDDLLTMYVFVLVASVYLVFATRRRCSF